MIRPFIRSMPVHLDNFNYLWTSRVMTNVLLKRETIGIEPTLLEAKGSWSVQLITGHIIAFNNSCVLNRNKQIFYALCPLWGVFIEGISKIASWAYCGERKEKKRKIDRDWISVNCLCFNSIKEKLNILIISVNYYTVWIKHVENGVW